MVWFHRRSFEPQGVRPLLASDAASMLDFLKRDQLSSIEPWESEKLLARAVEHNPAFGIFRDRRMVGCILVAVDVRANYRHLQVAGPLRGQGLGRVLLRKGMNAAVELGVYKHHGIARRQNLVSRSLLEAHGFESIAEGSEAILYRSVRNRLWPE